MFHSPSGSLLSSSIPLFRNLFFYGSLSCVQQYCSTKRFHNEDRRDRRDKIVIVNVTYNVFWQLCLTHFQKEFVLSYNCRTTICRLFLLFVHYRNNLVVRIYIITYPLVVGWVFLAVFQCYQLTVILFFPTFVNNLHLILTKL